MHRGGGSCTDLQCSFLDPRLHGSSCLCKILSTSQLSGHVNFCVMCDINDLGNNFEEDRDLGSG